MLIPLYLVIPFKFCKLLSIFSLFYSLCNRTFIGFFWLYLDCSMRDILGLTFPHTFCVILFTNRASSDCSLFSSLPWMIMLQDPSFFFLCSANAMFGIVIIIDRNFIVVGVISWLPVSLIESSLALLLSSTAAADAYGIWLLLCKALS